MFHSSKILIASLITLTFCVEVRAQANDPRQQSRDVVQGMRRTEPSDLTKENLERVAGSAAQIQAVLTKDPGILVELKRWVAKEASDNGQVVDDSMLTDQAIFDRLEREIVFRSVATRLVQQYGYLLPSINPDSTIAKEQDLVMKERVRRQAQREEREQTDSLDAEEGIGANRQQRGSTVERTECNSSNQLDCNRSTSPLRRRNSQQDETPGPEPANPIMPEQLSPSNSMRSLRTAGARDDSGANGSLGGFSSGLSSLDQGSLMPSDFSRRSLDSSTGANSSTGMDGIDSLLRRGNVDDLSALSGGNRGDTNVGSGKDVNRTERLSGNKRDGRGSGDQRRQKPLCRSEWYAKAILTPTFHLCTICMCRQLHGVASRSALAWIFFATGPALWMRSRWIFP